MTSPQGDLIAGITIKEAADNVTEVVVVDKAGKVWPIEACSNLQIINVIDEIAKSVEDKILEYSNPKAIEDLIKNIRRLKRAILAEEAKRSLDPSKQTSLNSFL